MLGTLETSLSLAIWEQAGQDISKRKEVSTQGRGGKRSLCSALCHTHRHQAALSNPAPWLHLQNPAPRRAASARQTRCWPATSAKARPKRAPPHLQGAMTRLDRWRCFPSSYIFFFPTYKSRTHILKKFKPHKHECVKRFKLLSQLSTFKINPHW